MDEHEKVRIAKVAIQKRMEYETLKYSDWLYGKESMIDEIWPLVEECDKIGLDAFLKKYPG